MDVGLDSQILSFLLKQRPPAANNPNQDVVEMYRRSRYLIEKLKADAARIIIPTVVVSEILIGVDAERHADFVAVIQAKFVVVPFDLRAASLAAELWRKNHAGPTEDKVERRYLKSDVLIVSSASVAGVRVFYSHDKKCRKLAELAGMTGRDLPLSSEFLFEMPDDEQKATNEVGEAKSRRRKPKAQRPKKRKR